MTYVKNALSVCNEHGLGVAPLRGERGPSAGHVRGQVVFIFFFQAEDGIRDLTVTGVQTCALPISSISSSPRLPPCATTGLNPSPRSRIVRDSVMPDSSSMIRTVGFCSMVVKREREIGRASCRERV